MAFLVKTLKLEHKSWCAAMENKKVFYDTHVTIENCGDIHPLNYPTFPNATTVTMRRCDKNFVFYWLNLRTFPKVKDIYLASHPCEMSVLYRFPNATIHLSGDFAHYKDRWAPKAANVVVSHNF